MNILVIVGSHARNLGLLNKLQKNKKINIKGLIIFKRENLIPKPNENLSVDLKKLWDLHFKKREKIEQKYYNFDTNLIQDYKNTLIVHNSEELHSENTKNYINKLDIDCCFIAGCPILKKNILDVLPEYTINLHLGLIPYYKGTITAFWPFYFLEPTMVGTTYHIIDTFVDTGEIIHQNVPELNLGDSMHEVSCKAVVEALNDLEIVTNYIYKRINNNIKPKKDPSLRNKGRLFKNVDWKPEMLKIIYDFFDDKIVDLYLKKQISCPKPKLIKI